MGRIAGAASYFQYWAKTRRGDEPGASCHLLPFHNLDVAAVGRELLSLDRPLAHQLAHRLGLPSAQVRDLLVFALGLHDMGKFARAFQGLAEPGNAALVPHAARYVYTVRHDQLGAMLWNEHWIGWMCDGTLGLPDVSRDRPVRRSLASTLSILMAPIFGHHGQPVNTGGAPLTTFFASDDTADDIEAAQTFVTDWASLVAPEWPLERLIDRDFQHALRALSWTIAGWAVLSDWLGSNQMFFPYHDTPIALRDYWRETALPQARAVIEATGVAATPRPVSYDGLAAWFGGADITPTPLQAQAENQSLGEGPQLFILEDVTGAGKTEAACILGQRLLAAGRGEGLYFALPTMATSNAMYARLGDLHRRFFTSASNPSFVLAHGARELNEDYVATIDRVQPADRDYAEDEPTASAQCNRWLADSRKKALLADVGVGTIDQVLLGVLPFKHQSLRLYGLARKVLVVDEVHAYDIYMQKVLEQLLAHHARQGGSVILLTATLPLRMREELVAAWQQGGDMPATPVQCRDFPLLTQVGAQGVAELPVATRASVARAVAVDWIALERDAIEVVLAAVDRGECVVWVRNTVDDAIRAFEAVRARHPDRQRCLLFHSRFVMADRQRLEDTVIARFGKTSPPADRAGQVLVATQVFQESLDCDADSMVSDIAPIDLLIQRAGRLQRHARGERRPPRLTVLAPEWSAAPDRDWLQRVLPGTQAVYRDASLCWLTQRVLREAGAIRMPEEARQLVESVYGDTAEDDLPEGLADAHWEQEGAERGAASLANYAVLDMAEGYRYDPTKWQDEQEVGTRLADEPTRNVVLLRRSEDGALALWVDTPEQHAAMLSQIRLRESQAQKLMELPSADTQCWEAMQETHRGLRYATPWVVGIDPVFSYSEDFGLVQKSPRAD